tara:strand:- start:31 stop:678 length:648 start_codon:yes stop_codon:yes gene_type:complete
MDHYSVNNLKQIKNEVYLKKKDCEIIAVSKTFQINQIKPLIDHGHKHFGENKVQEAIDKWTNIKNEFKDLKLHMIGSLQSNKVKYVLSLFDYIHSLDSFKLAKKISDEQIKKNKRLKIFIQVNIGNETQKSGIDLLELEDFYNYSVRELNLDIIGLMCIPPVEKDVIFFFKEMQKLSQKINVKKLSMGMSSDYSEAIDHGASFVRIGSKIFGQRS